MGSGVHNGRRVIVVVNGLKDEKSRAQESAKLLEWGLRRFENHKIFAAGDRVENFEVVMSKSKSIPAVLQEDLIATIPKAALKNFKISAKFKGPLIAPVKKGDRIGTLVVEIPDQSVIERPLYAAESAEKLGFFAGSITNARLFFSSKGSGKEKSAQ